MFIKVVIAVCVLGIAAVVVVVAFGDSTPRTSPADTSTPTPTPTPTPSTNAAQLSEVHIAAPDFTLPKLGGGELTLSNLQGKVVLLYFSSVGCLRTREDIPYLDLVGKTYDGSVNVVMVMIRDSESAVEEYLGGADLSLYVSLDSDARVATDYSIAYTPRAFFIDPDGVARLVHIGAFGSYEIAEAGVRLML